MSLEPSRHFTRAAAIEQAIADGLPALMPRMHRLFPLCRSITGAGVRDTLDVVGETLQLERIRVPTGTACFDWRVPNEWNIRDAYIKDAAGRRIIDFKANNLHLVSYSCPVRRKMTLAELQPQLHSLPDYPDAIPYRASYYNENWGFCLTHRQREALPEGEYEVVVDSTLAPGALDYAQLRLPGESPGEIFFSTYICHPSLANDQLSGIVLLAALMETLRAIPGAPYGFRAVFVPETIGAIAFLSQHHEALSRNMIAGSVVTCVGDDGPFTFLRSRRAGTIIDRAGEHVARHMAAAKGRTCLLRDFDPVGSDERQYCSPGLNLPVGSLMRSRYGEFAEYHTSKDNLDFVSEAGMQGSLEAYLRLVQAIETNCRPIRTNPMCEPQLGKRGLYSQYVSAGIPDFQVKILNLLNFGDGEHDLLSIADRMGVPVWTLVRPLEALVSADLLVLASA